MPFNNVASILPHARPPYISIYKVKLFNWDMQTLYIYIFKFKISNRQIAILQKQTR